MFAYFGISKEEIERKKIARLFYHKGHLVYSKGGVSKKTHKTLYYYFDTDQPYDMSDNTPCAKCGKPATGEGYDACLGKLNNVRFACCGHGITKERYVVEADGTTFRAENVDFNKYT